MTTTPFTLPAETADCSLSPDILDFAARRQGDAYLEPLLTATRQLFPTALSIQVTIADDPERGDDSHLAFDVRVASADVPDFVQAVHRWTDEKYRLCPASLVGAFRLVLTRVAA